MSKRRTFSREFKLEAVRKVIIHAMSTAEVARDLGIRDNQIYNWKKQFDADGTLDELIGKDVSTENELKRLRAEVRQLRMERDILKKATAFFAKEND